MQRVLLLGLLVAAASCAEDDEDRPPTLGSRCRGSDEPCRPALNNSSAKGPASPDGSVAPADAGSAEEGRLTGEVGAYRDTNFLATNVFSENGEVGGEGLGGRVTAPFTGSTYSIEGILLDPVVWMDVTALSSPNLFFTTLQPVDARDGTADLFMVTEDIMEQIGRNLLMPVEVRRDRAHTILRLVNEADLGLSGIRITEHGGEIVAYDTGGGLFRDDQMETAEQGLVAIINQEAVSLPGALGRIGYAGSNAAGTIHIQLALGAVTVATIIIDG